MSTDSDTPAGTTLDVHTSDDNVSAPAPANEHNRKHWRGVIHTHDRDLVVVGNQNFHQSKLALLARLPDNTELVKSLETDSFIEYDLLHMNSGIIIGSVTLEEVFYSD